MPTQTAIRSFEEAMQAVKEADLKLNNLFQLDNGRWRCNFRSSQFATEFAEGETVVEALQAAIHKGLVAKLPLAESAHSYVPPAPIRKKAFAQLTLADLGLA